MARYFFDIHDADGYRDEIGREFHSPKALRNEALKAIAGLTATAGETRDGWTIVLQVRDEQGGIALTIRAVCQVEDAIMPRPLPHRERIEAEAICSA